MVIIAVPRGKKPFWRWNRHTEMRYGWREADFCWPWFLILSCWIPEALHPLNTLSYFPLCKPAFCLISLRWFSFVCSCKELSLVIPLFMFSFINLVISIFNKDLLAIKTPLLYNKEFDLCSCFRREGASKSRLWKDCLCYSWWAWDHTWVSADRWLKIGAGQVRETNPAVRGLGLELCGICLTSSREGRGIGDWVQSQGQWFRSFLST